MDGGGDELNLKDGDRLKVTQSAIVLEKVIGQFLYGKAAETNSGK
jgi:phospholipid/cholesterol/gamma-HCH transport system substrate-binding protein